MGDENHKSVYCKKLRGMNKEELEKEMSNLLGRKRKIEMIMYSKQGTAPSVRNYPMKPDEWNGAGNIKQLKKDIARVQTMLTQK